MTRNLLRRASQFVFVGALVLAPVIRAHAGPATITYRRVFQGSVPEFIEIKITEPGKATFDIRQLSEEADPETFEVGQPVRQRIFELAASLKNFDLPNIDIQKKIANLGQKTFRYEHDSETHELTFNYTLNPAATQLMQIFEGLARQQADLADLARAVKYDRLGVNDAIRQFESDLDHRILPEPEHFLALLDQIAGDSHFIDIARTRARALAQRIRDSRQ